MLCEKQPHQWIPEDKLFSNSKDMTEQQVATAFQPVIEGNGPSDV